MASAGHAVGRAVLIADGRPSSRQSFSNKSLKVLLVAPGSPAERVGCKAGEEIVAINGHPIDAPTQARRFAAGNKQAAGTLVTLSQADRSHTLILADDFQAV